MERIATGYQLVEAPVATVAGGVVFSDVLGGLTPSPRSRVWSTPFGAAFAVVERSPATAKTLVAEAVDQSFMHGFGTACLVMSAVAFVGSLLAMRFLPAGSDTPTAADR